jgi:hypothetical protein
MNWYIKNTVYIFKFHNNYCPLFSNHCNVSQNIHSNIDINVWQIYNLQDSQGVLINYNMHYSKWLRVYLDLKVADCYSRDGRRLYKTEGNMPIALYMTYKYKGHGDLHSMILRGVHKVL